LNRYSFNKILNQFHQWCKSFTPRFALILLLYQYGVTFEYLPGRKQKNVGIVEDGLSHHDIDSLKTQEETEEVLPLLSLSEKNSISNINLTILMQTIVNFKEQGKVKKPGLREKGLAQPHYSIQHVEGYDLIFQKKIINRIYIPQLSRQMTMSTVLVP
jgi:hypothetical protein